MKFPTVVNGKELLDSAVIHLSQNDDVTLDIEGLLLKFVFETDVNDKNTGYVGNVEGSTLTITLKNFNNSLGEGIFTPFEVGFYKSRKLYVTFFVNTFDKNGRRFEYNLFLGEAHVE